MLDGTRPCTPTSETQRTCNPGGRAGCRNLATYTRKRWLRTPAVTVRGDHNATITFNSPLSRALGIARFTYVGVRHDPTTKKVEFVFANDEAAHGGCFALGFNGGSCKKKNSPSRCFEIPRHRVPFLALGSYRAQSTEGTDGLVVSIRLDDRIGA